MRYNFYILSALFLFSTFTFAQTLHVIQTGPGNSFSPSDLTINVQDTVRWVNSSGGFHNVVADDGSYTSGGASSSQWVFEHIFTVTGDSRYYCSIHGGTGGSGMSGIVHVNNVAGVQENNSQVRSYKLNQNYPNPFNPVTNIDFSIPKSQQVKIVVYNSLGQAVKQLANDNFTAGNHTVVWDGTNRSGNKVASAVYYYSLETKNNKIMKKMILSK